MICQDVHGGRSSRPHTHFDQSGLPRRPRNFREWWRFGVEQAEAAARETPGRLHQGDYPPDDHPGRWRVARRREDVIGALPFTRKFENYLDGRPVRSPLRSAMFKMGNRHRGRAQERQTHEFRILFALANGHTDPEVVRVLIGGCRGDYFEATALRALRKLWDETADALTATRPAVDNLAQQPSLPPMTSSASGTGDSLSQSRPHAGPPLCDCHPELHQRPPRSAA